MSELLSFLAGNVVVAGIVLSVMIVVVGAILWWNRKID